MSESSITHSSVLACFCLQNLTLSEFSRQEASCVLRPLANALPGMYVQIVSSAGMSAVKRAQTERMVEEPCACLLARISQPLLSAVLTLLTGKHACTAGTNQPPTDNSSTRPTDGWRLLAPVVSSCVHSFREWK